MPHEKIRRVRKAVQQRKAQARESAEETRSKLRSVKKKAGATKRRAGRAVAKRTVPVEDEAKRSVREAKLLAKEVGEPVVRTSREARQAAEGIRQKAAGLDDRMAEVREIERETLGMAGQDFDMDLEVVDDLERGDRMEGMGDVGMDVTFDDFADPDRTEDLDAIDDDILGDMEGRG